MKTIARLIVAMAILGSTSADAAVAFRALGTPVSGTAANLTLTEPSGSADGDIEIAVLYVENTTPPTVTPPSGWSNTFNGTSMVATLTTGSDDFKLYAYWIRRSGTPSLTWTFTSSFRAGLIIGYSGALASGDPWSFGTTAIRDDLTAATYPAVSGTTVDANEMLLWFGGNFIGGTGGTPPTGFTERLDSSGTTPDLEFAELVQVAAGATGSKTGANYTGGAGGPTGVLFGGLRPTGGAVTAGCKNGLLLLGVGCDEAP